MRIRTPDGGRVPFNAVAEMEETESPLFIQRFDRERAVRLTAEVDKELASRKKSPTDILRQRTARGAVTVSRRALAASAARSRCPGSCRGSCLTGAALALFLIYALMAIPLRSYGQPLLIMSVIPFGMIGALVGHWLLGIPVSMFSYFGIIALSGVVVNDSLILVDYINKGTLPGCATGQGRAGRRAGALPAHSADLAHHLPGPGADHHF